MERDLRRPGGEGGLLGVLPLMGIVEYAPVERSIGSLFIEILEELRGVFGPSAFGCRSFIFERFIGEDRGNLTKFKGFLRNLYLLFSRYEIFGGSRFTAMKNGEKDIDQCHI